MTDISATAAAAAKSAVSAAITGTAGKAIGDTSRLATKANMDAAAKKFEAIFANTMIKSMRSVHLADDVLGSEAQDTFKEMQDTNLAQSMAKSMPLGIGKALEAFLSRGKSALTDAQPSSSTGGEGGSNTKVT